MPAQDIDILGLDSAEVQEISGQIASNIQAAVPGLDVKRGVIWDIVVGLHASLTAAARRTTEEYLSSRSLLAVSNDPDLADAETLDHLFSNYRVTRVPGQAAVGDVAIVLSSSVSTTIASGSVFVAAGRRYTTSAAYTARSPEEAVSGPADRPMTPRGDGNFVFSVPVTAQDDGPAAAIKAGTLMIPDVKPRGYVTSHAAADFTGGVDVETNQAMLLRLQEGVAARGPSNRVGMNAMLRNDFGVSVVRTSIVGCGDPEMLRDKHNLEGVATGGAVDWWIRTDQAAAMPSVRVSASLISIADGVGVWQANLGRSEAAGVHEIAAVRRAGETEGSLTIVETVRGFDVSDTSHDVVTAEEAAFSAFQTLTVRFEDETDAAIGDRADYDLVPSGSPGIKDIQDKVDDRAYAGVAGDTLVKAPVPCVVSVTIDIVRQSAEAAPNAADIAAAVAAVVNDTGFVGALHASAIHDAVHGFLTGATRIALLDMFGRIVPPDDAGPIYIRSSSVLEVPDLPERMVSDRTTQFYCSSDQVAVNIAAGLPSPV